MLRRALGNVGWRGVAADPTYDDDHRGAPQLIRDKNQNTLWQRVYRSQLLGTDSGGSGVLAFVAPGQGRIINTTLVSVYLTIFMVASYAVAKTALKAWSHRLRLEMKPFGVQVIILEPGDVESAMTELGPDVAESQWNSRVKHRSFRGGFCLSPQVSIKPLLELFMSVF